MGHDVAQAGDQVEPVLQIGKGFRSEAVVAPRLDWGVLLVFKQCPATAEGGRNTPQNCHKLHPTAAGKRRRPGGSSLRSEMTICWRKAVMLMCCRSVPMSQPRTHFVVFHVASPLLSFLLEFGSWWDYSKPSFGRGTWSIA